MSKVRAVATLCEVVETESLFRFVSGGESCKSLTDEVRSSWASDGDNHSRGEFAHSMVLSCKPPRLSSKCQSGVESGELSGDHGQGARGRDSVYQELSDRGILVDTDGSRNKV